MTQPLALLLYEKLLPGSQLVNKLQDLGYRVETLSNPDLLVACAEQSKPMVVLVDLECGGKNLAASVSGLRQNPTTGHLPVIAFAPDNAAASYAEAQAAGATLAVGETAILNHLPQLLDQALQIE